MPQKEGYVFVGWSQNIPEKMPDSDLELTAVYEKIGTSSINKPSTTTASYGDSLVLHANIVGDVPEGWEVEWTSASGYFDIVKVEADGKSCMITPVANGTDAIIVTVYDDEGNVVSQDEQTITSKAGFFRKIIAFFKKLFGLTKIIPEAFRTEVQ